MTRSYTHSAYPDARRRVAHRVGLFRIGWRFAGRCSAIRDWSGSRCKGRYCLCLGAERRARSRPARQLCRADSVGHRRGQSGGGRAIDRAPPTLFRTRMGTRCTRSRLGHPLTRRTAQGEQHRWTGCTTRRCAELGAAPDLLRMGPRCDSSGEPELPCVLLFHRSSPSRFFTMNRERLALHTAA